jgi:hypothetical protein
MAQKTEPAEYRVPTRAKANMADFFAFLALVISIVALVLTIGARNMASDAQKTANNTKNYAQTAVDKALNEANKASTGGGTGQNNPQPAAGTTMPNGNGQ